MATLTELQDWRDALFKARLAGVRSVRDSNGQEISYSSDREMAAAIAAADRALAEAQSGKPPSTIIFRTSKGV